MGLKRPGRDLAGNAPVEYLSTNVAHALLRNALPSRDRKGAVLQHFSKPLRPNRRPHPHFTPIASFEQELIFTNKSQPRLPVEHSRFQSRTNRQPRPFTV